MDFQKRNPGKKVPDYYVDYGDKYANIFADEVYKNVSDKGKQWVSNTMRELQNKMEIALFDSPSLENDPEKLKDFAFESHSDAYSEGGLSSLDPSDIATIATAVDMKDISLAAIKEGFEVAPDVGAAIWNSLSDTARKQLSLWFTDS